MRDTALPESVVIGIDPGKSGALALVGLEEAVAYKLDNTERDIYEKLVEFAAQADFAFIEKVNAMPKQGVSSTFKFGQSYGFLRGILVASGIPFEYVTPAKWQRALSCLSGGDKNVTKGRAQELFPNLKITHAIADSLLIAEYGRRVRDGEL
jgi:crossover junction endodeoxyribonuclease RuvC